MPYGHSLTDEEKHELLRIARATLREYLISGDVPPGTPHRRSLTDPAGAFVSLHLGDDLRGCIGTLQELDPLYRTIQEMVVAAAVRDPRFDPVTPEELDRITIEVSVLGQFRRVHSPAEIQVGRDGVSLEAAGRRGLLLPQVAIEYGWDAHTFLEHTCVKAGLPPTAWQRADAIIETFSAQVFGEAARLRVQAGAQ